MNIRIQVLIFVTVVIALFVIVNMIRKRKLELKYSLIWFALGVGIMVLNLFPSLLLWLSNLVGIVEPVNMIFFFGFCILLAVMFTLTLSTSKMSVEIKNLTQSIALLEKKVMDRDADSEGDV